MFSHMSLNVLWGHSMDLLYINCSVMNPQVNGHTGLSDVSQRRTVSETLVQSTSKAGEIKVCALGVIKEYQGDLSPGMPLVHKNERKACHYFISLVNLHWKQIYTDWPLYHQPQQKQRYRISSDISSKLSIINRQQFEVILLGILSLEAIQ